MGIKERIWKRATTELTYQDSKRNFEYEEPIIDLTLSEVEKVIDEGCGNLVNPYKNINIPCGDIAGGKIYYCEKCEKLKLRLRGK